MVKKNTWIALGAIALIVMAGAALTGFSLAPSETSVIDDETTLDLACDIEDVTVRTVTEDPFAKGSNKDVLTYLYTTDYNRVSNADDQSDLTASTNEDYILFAFDDGSANADGASDWYGQILDKSIGCKGVFDVYFTMYKEGSPSLVVYNDDGSVNANTSNQQTLGANDEYDLEFEVKAPNDAAFGAPHSDANMLVCFDYNTSEIDEVKIEGASRASVPQFDVATSEECYMIDRASFSDDAETGREKGTLSIVIDTDNSNNPSDGNDINIRLMDPALFIHSDSGVPTYGVQDDDGDDVGVSATNDGTIYVA